MADEYTPTTEQVRRAWIDNHHTPQAARAEFERWLEAVLRIARNDESVLAAHEKEVRERIAQKIEAHEEERRRLGMVNPKKGRVDPISGAYEHSARIVRGETGD